MIFDTFVGTKANIKACAEKFNSGPEVDRVKHYRELEQLLEELRRDEHYLNVAVICGNYEPKTQAEIRNSIRKYEPKATVIFYSP